MYETTVSQPPWGTRLRWFYLCNITFLRFTFRFSTYSFLFYVHWLDIVRGGGGGGGEGWKINDNPPSPTRCKMKPVLYFRSTDPVFSIHRERTIVKEVRKLFTLSFFLLNFYFDKQILPFCLWVCPYGYVYPCVPYVFWGQQRGPVFFFPYPPIQRQCIYILI